MTLPVSNPRVEQRRGIGFQFIIIPEDSWDNDPAIVNAYVGPVAEKVSLKTTQAIEDAPVYDGTMLPPQVVDMNNEAGGSVSFGLDYKFLARVLKLVFNGGVTQPEGATGKLKRFTIPTNISDRPKSFQTLQRHLEGTTQIFRNPGCKVGTIQFPFSTVGRATYSVNVLGSGRLNTTYPPAFPANPVKDAYSPANYTNMRMVVNNKIVVGLTSFDDTLDCQAKRTEVGANEGYAGGITTSFFKANGNLGTIWGVDGDGIESNDNLLSLARNKTVIPLECIYANKPLDQATEWFRRRYYIRISMTTPDGGGDEGETQEVEWRMVREGMWPAEIIGENLGSYTIPGASVLEFTVTGTNAGTISVSIAAGVKTAKEIADILNADVAFAAALEADSMLGRLRIQKKTNDGADGTLAVNTAAVGSCHALLGFTATVYAGYGTAAIPCPLVYDVFSTMTDF